MVVLSLQVTKHGGSLVNEVTTPGGRWSRAKRFEHISEYSNRTGERVGPGSYHISEAVSRMTIVGPKITTISYPKDAHEWHYIYVDGCITRIPKRPYSAQRTRFCGHETSQSPSNSHLNSSTIDFRKAEIRFSTPKRISMRNSIGSAPTSDPISTRDPITHRERETFTTLDRSSLFRPHRPRTGSHTPGSRNKSFDLTAMDTFDMELIGGLNISPMKASNASPKNGLSRAKRPLSKSKKLQLAREQEFQHSPYNKIIGSDIFNRDKLNSLIDSKRSSPKKNQMKLKKNNYQKAMNELTALYATLDIDQENYY